MIGSRPRNESAENTSFVRFSILDAYLFSGLTPASLETCASTALPLLRPPSGPLQCPPEGAALAFAMLGSSPSEKTWDCKRLVKPLSFKPLPVPPGLISKCFVIPLPTSLHGAVSFKIFLSPRGGMATILRRHTYAMQIFSARCSGRRQRALGKLLSHKCKVIPTTHCVDLQSGAGYDCIFEQRRVGLSASDMSTLALHVDGQQGDVVLVQVASKMVS